MTENLYGITFRDRKKEVYVLEELTENQIYVVSWCFDTLRINYNIYSLIEQKVHKKTPLKACE